MNIAIIPARHGSKSILNKNLQKIGTKSLVDQTILSAIDSGIFQQIILTTDIPILLDQYRGHPQVTLRSRPKNLATDASVMSDVVRDALDTFGIWPEARIWILQPTACFRRKEDYVAIKETFMDLEVKSVFSVFDVEACHPNRMYTIKDNTLYPLRFTSFKNKQDLPSVYQRSGHFYVFYAKDFRGEGKFFIRRCVPYVIDRVRGIHNIDSPLDLKIAKLFHEAEIC